MQLHRLFRAASLVTLLVGALACSTATSSESDGFPDVPYGNTKSAATTLGISIRTAPSQPPVRGQSRAELEIRTAEGAPRDGLTLVVTPWMPAHGHGAPNTPTVTALGDGRYLVDELTLTMAGAWELRVEISDADGLVDNAVVKVDVR